MKGVRELKVRIKSVQGIKKITRAMEMVAATKLRRLQERALRTRPFADRIEALMKRVALRSDPEASPLLGRPSTVESEALVVVGADKGLCGAFNANLFRHVIDHLQGLKEEGVTPRLWVFGRRPRMFLRKYGASEPVWVYEQPVERLEYPAVRRVMEALADAFTEGLVQRVRVVSTRMRSTVSFQPTTQEILPVSAPEAEEDAGTGADYILEPDPDTIMRKLLPRYLEMQLYAAILESLASEFAARRIAMKNATDAANDMLGTLGREYNKARQESITNDLLDIVGGTVVQAG